MKSFFFVRKYHGSTGVTPVREDGLTKFVTGTTRNFQKVWGHTDWSNYSPMDKEYKGKLKKAVPGEFLE